MQKYKNIVLGTGIGGVSIAAKLKECGENDFIVIERNKEFVKTLQNGLHYLHSIDFNLPFEFEFKKVTLTEEIWDTKNNIFKKNATIPEMFQYSKKLMENMRHPSSIMDPGKNVEVWLPESNDMGDLLQEYFDYAGEEHFLFDNCLNAIDSEKKVITLVSGNGTVTKMGYENLISTAPLPYMFDFVKWEHDYEFKNKELYITNYDAKNIVPNWLLVFYMFDSKFPPYRMTVMNNIISMESMYELSHEDEIIIKYLIDDLLDYDLSSKNAFKWGTGRIFGLQKTEREEIVNKFIDADIFLMGRYGLWNGRVRMDDTILQGEAVAYYLNDKIKKDELLKLLV